MKKSCLALSALAFGGCALLSGVTPIGNGAFMASVHSNDVNATVAEQKAKAMDHAVAFCSDRAAAVDVIRVVAESPAPGRSPSAEIDFRCK